MLAYYLINRCQTTKKWFDTIHFCEYNIMKPTLSYQCIAKFDIADYLL